MKKDAETTEPDAHAGSDPEQGDGSDRSERSSPSELEARCAELEARWLRSQADFQNVRRRAQQELDSALFRTLQPMLEELLLVSDYLDMALATPATTDETKALAAGVSMTRAKLAQVLELAEVRPVPTEGDFDPTQHEAAESRFEAGREPGQILATLRAGYTWQGRILRPARVVVAVSEDPAQPSR